MGPCSMSASKTNRCYTLFQFHPFWVNFLWSLWGTLGPFPSAWETSCTRLMGLPVIQSRARVTDADCGMSIHLPCHGPEQCSIKWYQGRIGCDILLLIHITQIMQKLCTLCKYYANFMQKLRRNYAEIMQKLCRYYAEIMYILCKLCKYYANIMQKLCRNYADIMQKLCRNYAEIMQIFKLCRYYAEIMQILCRNYANYAEIMQKLCRNYANIMHIINIPFIIGIYSIYARTPGLVPGTNPGFNNSTA